MIDIGKIKVKNKYTEVTLGEFDRIITSFANTEDLLVEKYIEILLILGVTNNEIETLSIDDLNKFIRGFLKSHIKMGISQKIEIEGEVFKAYEGEKYDISVKDLWQIEKHVKKNKTLSLLKSCAIIYKSQTSITPPYDEEEIERKSQIFGNQPIYEFYGLCAYICLRMGQKITLLNEAANEVH